jgi:hypothetical protein
MHVHVAVLNRGCSDDRRVLLREQLDTTTPGARLVWVRPARIRRASAVIGVVWGRALGFLRGFLRCPGGDTREWWGAGEAAGVSGRPLSRGRR